MGSADLLQLIERMLYVLPDLLALFIAILCISRSTDTGAVLMIIGAPLDLLSSIGSIVLWELIYDGEDYGSIELINKAISNAGLLGRLLFFSGTLLFALRQLPPRRPVR
jgi:hypothetical protein